MSERPLTILFMPESAYGPTNDCIGIGDVLRRRGHRVVFAAEASNGSASPKTSSTWRRPAETAQPARTPGSSGKISSAILRRSSASPRSSSWTRGSGQSGRS